MQILSDHSDLLGGVSILIKDSTVFILSQYEVFIVCNKGHT